MRNFKSFAARVGVIAYTLVAASSVMAADPPTTAVALAQSVDLSDAKAAGLVIIGLLVAVGVTLWGARLVLSKFRPKA
jgi:hypothetical protein